MVNKKGFIRVVEAVIAILLILGVLLIISAQRSVPERRDFGSSLPPLLDEMAQNFSLRDEIISSSDENNLELEIESFLDPRISNPSLEYKVEVCNLEDVCFLEPYPNTEEEIFAYERVISASVRNESFAPKKVKVFLWRK